MKSNNIIKCAKKILFISMQASGPESSVHFEALACSAQRDFKGETWRSHVSPLKSPEGHVGKLPNELHILPRILQMGFKVQSSDCRLKKKRL
jgi:hypothetical protein